LNRQFFESNHKSNPNLSNQIFNVQIKSPKVFKSRFKSNRDWDLPITGHHTDKHGQIQTSGLRGENGSPFDIRLWKTECTVTKTSKFPAAIFLCKIHDW